MTVAIIMPQKIAREDFLISISRRDAIRDPVHAPVPGSGIPTKSNNATKRPIFQFHNKSPKEFRLF